MRQRTSDLQSLRHSAAHLLAAAVMDLYPDALCAIGPSTKEGFYYDFEFKKPISADDLPEIEKKMHELVKSWKRFERHELTAEEAKKKHKDNPYKSELIEELIEGGREKISYYTSGTFCDLCKGGHVENPSTELKHFKLLSIAGAYWRGNEKNKMLTRIYGTAFHSKKELDEYLAFREEVKLRDHRALGKKLCLFTFSNLVGKGLPLFTEKGAVIWRELERFVVDEEIKRGYKHVRTPNLAKTDLYKKSGHYPYYKDTMYPPMAIDEDELILRPMTCPHHFALFMDKPRSYRELPLRYAEMASLYRYEKSGELTGLLRVREFVLADSHNFVRKIQAEDEVHSVLDLIEFIARSLTLKMGKDFIYRLSLGNRKNKEKYYSDTDSWEYGEELLRGVLKNRSADFYEAKDEAAFYGPKIDVQMKNVLGKEDTAFTVQYDFCLPARFNLEFTNEKGEAEQPIVIHRSSIGAMERSIGFLIEHFAGAFPLWLSPIQVILITISDKHIQHANKTYRKLKEAGIRVEADDRPERMQAKIRQAALQKVPYIGIIGDREVEANTIAVRKRNGENIGQLSIDAFITNLKDEIEKKI